MTATLVLPGEQIVSLFEQLEPQIKRMVLYNLAETAAKRQSLRPARAESALRRRASERGLNWDMMNEQAREEMIDDLVHEDR